MKLYENILKQFIDVPKDIYELTNSYITEVEDFKKLFDINNLVIGYVSELVKHPDADTLSVTKVNVGDEVKQIVCGAPNVAKGQYVIVALEGAVLPGDFKIKKSKIRGVESFGMICSLSELGIEKDLIPEKYSSGIYYFDTEKKVGSNPLRELMLDGFILELSLTPNRNDLLSHYGYARDLAAVLNKEIELKEYKINEIAKKNELSVKIESKNTNSYYARYFSDVKIQESPLWLKVYLKEMGVNPVNNIVDITNYILYTYGIPMHAFDANKFNSKTIVVKDNDKKQTVKTLDGSDIEITSGEILITNGKDIMALGGIMGLDNSKISENTSEIILEVASFSRETTRETSKKTNLTSDSQLRFERGIDEAIMLQALNHATYLFETLASAKTHQGISSEVLKQNENPFIKIDLNKINEMIGTNIEDKMIYDILDRLNFEVNKKTLEVKAPSYRSDILIFADVLEEVLRIYGLDNVKMESLITTSSKGLTDSQKMVRKLRHYLSDFGLNEVITYSLLKEENVNKYNTIGDVVKVIKPISNDRRVIRQSLINGLVDAMHYNQNRMNNNVNLFEIGNVYAKDIEQRKLAILLTGDVRENPWKKTSTKIDFYYLSGILANIMTLTNVLYELEESNNPMFHPHQQANIIVDKKVIGIIGKLHPKHETTDTFVLELDLGLLINNNKFKYKMISKYPNVERDIAIIVEKDLKANNIIKVIEQTLRKNLVKVELFDIYDGKGIKEGFKSLAFNIVFNDDSKTLEKEEVDKLMKKVTNRLMFEFNAEIRE